jgi:hypothetical protein
VVNDGVRKPICLPCLHFAVEFNPFTVETMTLHQNPGSGYFECNGEVAPIESGARLSVASIFSAASRLSIVYKG